jgi:hypothetical protein
MGTTILDLGTSSKHLFISFISHLQARCRPYVLNKAVLLYRSISAALTLIPKIGKSSLNASRSNSCIPILDGGLRLRRDEGPGPACDDFDIVIIGALCVYLIMDLSGKGLSSLFMDC